jgi:hypothetical protein
MKMMNEWQLRQKIKELEMELAAFKNVLETPANPRTKIGRPLGSSTKYGADRIIFLEECEKQGLSDKEIISGFNAKFNTNIPINSRALYNLMQRKGIRKTGWRWKNEIS